MPTQFSKPLDDDCPQCNVPKEKVKLHAETRGAKVYIVCSKCGFEMTDQAYSAAKASGKF